MILTLVVGAAGIPVLIHTCSQNLETDVHLFASEETGDCHMDCALETDCCTQENQHVDLDLDHLAQVLVNHLPIISFHYQPIEIHSYDLISPTSFEKTEGKIYYDSGRTLRLEFQSILC